MSTEPDPASSSAPVVATCTHCGKPIRAGARRCPFCRSVQHPTSIWRRPLLWITAATTVLSLIFSVQRLYGAWASAAGSRKAVAEHVTTARVLAGAGDFATAWQSLERAQAVDPTAKEIGVAQIEIVSEWILAAGAPIGWVPQVRAGSQRPTATAGAIADEVYAALVTAAVSAKGTNRAELEGLAAWARYLRGRELRGRRRDIAADLEAALERDPLAYYPNLFLGFWRAAMQDDPMGSEEPWERALAAERSRGLSPQVRSLQLYVLGRRVEGAHSTDDPAKKAANRAARAIVLRTLDQMRTAGESPVPLVRPSLLAALYIEPGSRPVLLDDWSEVLPTDRQLAILDWLAAELPVRPASFRDDFERFRFIRSRLLEKLGRGEEARQEMATARTGNLTGRLRELVDEAWIRLTGEEVVPANEWAARAYHLQRASFDSPEIKEALAALRTAWDGWPAGWSPELEQAVDAALRRIDEQLESSGSTTGALAPRELEEWRRELLHFRGAMRLESDLAAGARDLEGLLRDPALSLDSRRRILVDLAGGYAHAEPARRFDQIGSESEHRVTMAYLSEGLDRLGAALEAGYTDWDWVESNLAPLRKHPAYPALSLRHHRVPPKDE